MWNLPRTCVLVYNFQYNTYSVDFCCCSYPAAPWIRIFLRRNGSSTSSCVWSDRRISYASSRHCSNSCWRHCYNTVPEAVSFKVNKTKHLCHYINVISRDPPFIDWHVRFTTVHFRLSIKNGRDNNIGCRFLLQKQWINLSESLIKLIKDDWFHFFDQIVIKLVL